MTVPENFEGENEPKVILRSSYLVNLEKCDSAAH